jgi:ATP-binding cassette subfamily B protein
MKLRNQIKKDNQAALRYYWTRARAYPKRVAGVAIAMPLTILVNNYLPSLILATVLSKLSQHQFHANDLWGSFGAAIAAYAALLFVGILMWRIIDFFVWKLEQDIQRDIAQDVFSHMLDRSADFHANNFTGSLVSHTNKLLGGYIRLADTTIFQTYPMIAGVLIAIIILGPRAPLFAAALAVFAVLYVVAAIFVSRPVRRLSATYANAESKQTGYLADAITNALAINAWFHEPVHFGRGVVRSRFGGHEVPCQHRNCVPDF